MIPRNRVFPWCRDRRPDLKKKAIRRTEPITLIEKRLEMISPAPDMVGNGRKWGAVTPFNLYGTFRSNCPRCVFCTASFTMTSRGPATLYRTRSPGGYAHISGRCGTITTINSLHCGGWKIGRSDECDCCAKTTFIGDR